MGDTTRIPPVINSAPITAPVIRSAPITTPVISQLSEEQQHAAERTHRHRTNIDRSNIPIPQSDDSSQEESDSLFDDKLLPADKNKLMRLRMEIKRIKGGTVYPTGYEKDRARAIREADALRLAGKAVPAYLEGVKLPWISMGYAYRHYDDNEVSKREAKIEKIKRLNAEHCQQEHIANMPSIDRKGGPGGQVQG
jgi:hypothetical protein